MTCLRVGGPVLMADELMDAQGSYYQSQFLASYDEVTALGFPPVGRGPVGDFGRSTSVSDQI